MRLLDVVWVGGSLVLALGCRKSEAKAKQAPAVVAPAAATHGAGLDMSVVRYRFVDAPAPEAELTSAIHDLEARIADMPSPFDMTDLAELYFRRAQRDGDQDDYARSEAMARRSLEMLSFPNGARLTLAKIAGARHEFRESIRLGREQLEKKPTAGAYTVVASAHLALGELADASAAAEAAVTLAPSTSTYLMRALVLQAAGRDDEAAFDFARAAKVETFGDPQEAARLRTLWGRFLLRRGDLAGAGVLFDEALRIVPEFPLALAQRAELALRTGHLKEARAGFEQAFAMSRQVRYLIDLARAQELSGDAAAADSSRAQVETIVRAELAANGFGHQLDLIEVLVDRGAPADLAEAVTLGRAELTRRPSADCRFQLARALARTGAHAEASLQVQAALASGARDARLYELAARLEAGPRSDLYRHEAEALDPGASGWRQLGMEQ
jgi:tetratricopeptide (TPR) repeat protein